MSRIARTASDREASSNRPSFGRIGKGYLHVDVDKLDPTCEYVWITETVRGADANDNVRRSMSDRGFEPVTCGELPSEKPITLPGDDPVADNVMIRRGGLVLMKRPKAYADEERAELMRTNAETVRAVKRESADRYRGNEYFRDANSTVTERREVQGGKFPDA